MLGIYTEVFGRRRALNIGTPLKRNAPAALEALDAVQTVVDALTDHRGGRFTVRFCEEVAASTELTGRKRVVISSTPLFDKNLSLAQAVEVMTGLTCHEVGHMNLTPVMMVADKARWPEDKLAHKVSNILEDVRLEQRMAEGYPGIAGSFVPTLRWVGRQTIPPKPINWRDAKSLTDRVNFMLVAIRYPFAARWVGNASTREQRAWWEAWAEEFTADDSVELHIAGVEAGMDRLRAVKPLDDDPTTEDEPVDEPEPEDLPQPTSNVDDDDDEDFDDEDFDDEDFDEPRGGNKNDEDEDEDEPKPDETEPSEGKDDEDDDEAEPEPENKPEGKPGTGEKGEQPDEPEEQLDEKALLDDIDDMKETRNDRILDKLVEDERKVERVRSNDGFGSMRMEVDL